MVAVRSYTYDVSHRLLTITDPRGLTFLRNEYDGNGRVSRQIQADGGVFTFAYTLTSGVVTQTGCGVLLRGERRGRWLGLSLKGKGFCSVPGPSKGRDRNRSELHNDRQNIGPGPAIPAGRSDQNSTSPRPSLQRRGS